uniref:Uncharacterized protein n=1 Tax=Gossypium raimondii TaxID=29730 RepID=A0A0D2NZC4_GOSRA|nr:hypothetical protein B456_003G105900 [Gossypium raimondii]
MKTEAESTSHFPVKSNSLDSITSFNFSFQKHQVFSEDSNFQEIFFFSYLLPFQFIFNNSLQSGFCGHLSSRADSSIVSPTRNVEVKS